MATLVYRAKQKNLITQWLWAINLCSQCCRLLCTGPLSFAYHLHILQSLLTWWLVQDIKKILVTTFDFWRFSKSRSQNIKLITTKWRLVLVCGRREISCSGWDITRHYRHVFVEATKKTDINKMMQIIGWLTADLFRSR